MASQLVNKKNFNLFRKQAKGNGLYQIRAERDERRGQVRILYTARDDKGRILSGEWVVDKKDRDEADVQADLDAFYELAEKDFSVERISDAEETPSESS